MHRRLNADLWAGLLFFAIGLAGLAINDFERLGTAFRMGPAYMPVILSALLTILGGVIAARGLVRPSERLQVGNLRPVLCVAVAVLCFAAGIRLLGLVPTIVLTMGIASLGLASTRWRETAIAAVIMSIASCLVFIWGLGMTISVIGQ